MAKAWERDGQGMVKEWSMIVKELSRDGQGMAKAWSRNGQGMAKE